MENQDSDRSKDVSSFLLSPTQTSNNVLFIEICYVALKLDQPQMLLDIGISVDLSFCKGVQKTDGQPCHNFVNK